MKNELKKLCAEKAINAIKEETQDLNEIRKSLSCAYTMIAKEIKK